MTDKNRAPQLPGDAPSRDEPSLEGDEGSARTSNPRMPQGNDVLLRLHRAGKAKAPPESIPADNGETDLLDRFDLALREFQVKRDDHLPLQFTGYIVGWNEVERTVPRGTQVCIFATRGGKIITSVHQWQKDETRQRERHAAAVHTSPDDALAWLIRDGGNQLGRASREAWELACQVWPALQGREVELVD